ncbi:MAG: hypothetical protein U0R80_13470 [Nocardioidaceae bacterium]
MKTAALLATAVLVAGSATACGGGGDSVNSPSDASVDDYCQTFVSVFTDIGTDPTKITGKQIKDWGKALEDTGTPKDMSDDERQGFEIFVSFAKSVDENASIDDIEDPKVSDDEQKQVDDYLAYSQKSCAQAMTDAIGGSAG